MDDQERDASWHCHRSAAVPALSQLLSRQLSQPQQHGEVSGSKLIRRPHGFGPLRLGQPRSGPRCIEGYWWQCQDAPSGEVEKSRLRTLDDIYRLR